jgi:hypothetical protein
LRNLCNIRLLNLCCLRKLHQSVHERDFLKICGSKAKKRQNGFTSFANTVIQSREFAG